MPWTPCELIVFSASFAETDSGNPRGRDAEQKAVQPNDLPRLLGALGYLGFTYLAGGPAANPAAVVLTALRAPLVPARVTEALPWVLMRYVDLDWQWLMRAAKMHDLQNKLGFLTSVARRLAHHGDLQCAGDNELGWEFGAQALYALLIKHCF